MRKNRRFLVFILFILTTLIFSGCSARISGPPKFSTQVSVSSENSIGQTFYSRFRGLSGIELFIGKNGNQTGDIFITVYKTPDKSTLLSQGTFPIQSLADRQNNYFNLPRIENSNQQTFYFEITTNSISDLSISSLPGYSDIDGSAYRNKAPIDQTLDFSLEYSWFQVGISVVIWLIRTLQSLFFALFLFFVPGFGILIFFDLYEIRDARTFIIKVALSIAISLAVYPIVLVWTNRMGLQLGRLNAYLPSLLGTSLIFYRYFQKKISLTKQVKRFIETLIQEPANELPLRLIVIILSVIIFSRFWSIRDIPVPMWGDSVHHTAIAQLILDNGGLFSSWEPIAPYNSLTIHWGFSSLAAVYAWFSGEDVLNSTLIVGQWINIFSLITPVLLIARFTKKLEWGLIGFLISVGLLSIIPGIYTSWGRYAQLAGQIILPAVVFLSLELLHPKQSNTRFFSPIQLRLTTISAFLFAGMTLTHYRMPFFWLTLFGVFYIHHCLSDRVTFKIIWNDLLSFFFLGFSSILLIAPWVPRLIDSNLSEAVSTNATPIDPLDWLIGQSIQWTDIQVYIPSIILIVFGLSLVYAIFKKQLAPVLLGIWPIFLMVYLAGVLIDLPFSNLLEGFAIKIMSYIPIGLVIGWAFSETMEKIRSRNNYFLNILSMLSVMFICVFGWNIQSSTIQPNTYAMVTHPDLKAMNWIKENTPQDSIFLVEGFSVHFGYSTVGADGGWWIPLLADRANTQPPQYAMVNEQPTIPGSRQKTVELVEFLENHNADDQDSIAALCDNGITHIYIGQGQGMTGAGVTQLFSADEFLADPETYALIYSQDRVRIFEINPAACSK